MKKKTNTQTELTLQQIDFIKNKVIELGSIEAVKKFYHKKCTVDSFARTFAITVYLIPKKGGK